MIGLIKITFKLTKPTKSSRKRRLKFHEIILYGSIKNTPKIRKSFLRLNDRKKSFTIVDFLRAGYHTATLSKSNSPQEIDEIENWCDKELGHTWCKVANYWCFQNETDATLFKMTWM